MAPYVAAGAFFSQKNGPLILGVTHKWIWIWIYPVCDPMGYPINKRGGCTWSQGCDGRWDKQFVRQRWCWKSEPRTERNCRPDPLTNTKQENMHTSKDTMKQSAELKLVLNIWTMSELEGSTSLPLLIIFLRFFVKVVLLGK